MEQACLGEEVLEVKWLITLVYGGEDVDRRVLETFLEAMIAL